MVDILGHVIYVSPASTVQKRDGLETIHHIIGLRDMLGYRIDILLWGEHYQIEGAQLANLRGLDTPQTLAIKCGCVTKFNGRTVGTISNTNLFINPIIEENFLLQTWFHDNGIHSALPSLS